MRRLSALAILALACSGAREVPPDPPADAPPAVVDEGDADSGGSGPQPEPRPERPTPEAPPAPVPTIEEEEIEEPPPSEPVEPPPVEEEEPPPEEPEDPPPTPEDPDVYDCLPGAGCDACRAELDPELAAEGAEMCLFRLCAESPECSDLDAAAECLPGGSFSGPTAQLFCRFRRGELNEPCDREEGGASSDELDECEPGLWCRPYGIAGLRCRPFED